MPTATITVKYVNAAKPGARKGSVKDATGTLYLVWADKLATFQPNGIYDIEYTTEQGNDGKVWNTIKTATPKGQAALSFSSSSGVGGGYQGPRRSGNTYRETSQRDAERMFVCSLLNAAITAGRVELTQSELVQAVETLRDTWDATFGADQQQAQAA